MPSLESPPRRRPRAEIESDEEADALRASQRSTPSSTDSAKRVRTNGNEPDSDSESSEPGPSRPNGISRRRNELEDDEDEDIDEDEAGPSEFQPGAIVRVKLTNFVTYEKAEFFPGPNLNMVIGPNGTGKSSLVCAICLGLGWGPKHLGRAGEVGEFVKHGMSDAFVEIELHRRRNESRNHIVKLRIVRDGNQREFWLDGKKSSLKSVQILCKDLSIQVDNLCQFLPQDKVSSFSGMSPIILLEETQRAAAPGYMLEWHEELKKLRKEQKKLEIQDEAEKDQLGRLESRQQNLQAEVDRVQERIRVQEKVDLLQKMVPFVEYALALEQNKIHKTKKKEAQSRFNELKAKIAPTLQSINAKKRYKEQIEDVIEERKRALKTAEKDADAVVKDIEGLSDEAKKHEGQVKSIIDADKKAKAETARLERKIDGMKKRQDTEAPIQFNAVEWNGRVRVKEQQVRGIKNQLADNHNQYMEYAEQARLNRQSLAQAERELASFDTQEGQQMNKLERVSKDTAAAWKWVQENLDSFEKEVYGPPMITCSIKDPRYVDAVESLLSKNEFLVITAQTLNDLKRLSDQFTDVMHLGEVTLRQVGDDQSVMNRPKPLSQQDFQRAGMDGWAIDYIDGPIPILEMLCSSGSLHQCPIGLNEPSEAQYTFLTENKHLKKFVTGTHSFQIARRAEYGPQAVSTTSRSIQKAKFWTDQPIDVAARREIQAKINSFNAEYQTLSGKVKPVKQQKAELNERASALSEEIKAIKAEKETLQKAYVEQKALPDKIKAEEEVLERKAQARQEDRDQIRTVLVKIDHAVLRRAKRTLDYKDYVSKIRKCHEDLIEAEIRLIEAVSDVTSLEERHAGTIREQAMEQEKLRTIEAESLRVKEVARKALVICKELMADPENARYVEDFTKVEGLTVEGLEMEIAAEESKLEFIHAGNPNAIKQFEHFQSEVNKLQRKVKDTETTLLKIGRDITRTRDKWEPELDTLIAKISEAFSYNFEQIGCAGEVSVHKDDDFEKWAIQIKVKFRENETLQQLDEHRQSGGERSVSTIFYLMSLQSMAQAPFRVVDEINQGMDPRNERMVHERMVEIACKEHTSQYFLITPKLLTGLRYDKRMKVLCIASGEHMPVNYQRMDISKVIGIKRAIMASG